MIYSQDNRELYPRMTPGRGIVLFFCLFIAMFFMLSVVSTLLMTKGSNQEAMIRISAVLQDIFVFILPAIVTAILMSRVPARFLFLEKAPRIWPLLLGIVTLYAAMPWMECVIQWNNSISFPSALKELENSLREMEAAAEGVVSGMLKGSSVGSLIVSICIVGVLAGLSEELFFRGAMLRLFMMTRINYHFAIWAVALIFSLLHFQFFGFVPRLLLGAYFGYLACWSKCLWIPILAHIFNNSTVVVAQWYADDAADASRATSLSPSTVTVIISIVLTVVGLYLFLKTTRNDN